MFSFKYSLTWSSSTIQPGLWDLGFLKTSSAVKNLGKESIQYFDFFIVPGNQVYCFLQERAHISPTPPFITEILVDAPPVALDFLGQIQFNLVFNFLNLISSSWTMSLYPMISVLASTLWSVLFLF